jgi:hypothetical protein
MSLLTIAGWNPYPAFQYPNVPTVVRIWYDQTFIASDGEQVIGSQVGSQGFFKEVACTIVGGQLNIPSFTLITTDDQLPQGSQQATATAVIYQGSTRGQTLFSGFTIPNGFLPSCTIADLTIFNQAQSLVFEFPQYLNREQVIALISSRIPSSVVRAGNAILVGGLVVVNSAFVTSVSIIGAIGQDADAGGDMSIIDRTPGVSFTIESSNPADFGVVGWTMTEPT